MSAAPVLLEVDDGVATLTLNRPDAGNALDFELTESLGEAADSLASGSEARVVIIRTAGPSFCVGGDLRWMSAQDDRAAGVHRLAGSFHAALLTLSSLDAPVIAVVDGIAAGGGMSLVTAADLAFATDKASFVVAYTSIGFSPDGGASWHLPRIVGRRRAAELMLTNRRVGAEEAERIGLVNAALPESELEERVSATVATLRDGSLEAHGAVKRLLDASAGATLADQLDREAAQIAELAGSAAGIEGVDAFLARRKPEF